MREIMIKIAIVEDEDIYVDTLSTYIEKFAKEKKLDIKVKIFRDGDEIVENYKANFDIILMDIQMRFMDGMGAASYIRELDKEVSIIFITNRADYAIKGYEVGALDYILKPVEYFSFSTKLERAVEKISTNNKKSINISVAGSIKKLFLEDIIYMESIGHNIHFYTRESEFVSRLKISDMEKELAEYNFYRINKGYIVNMAHIDSINANTCILGDYELAISRNKKADFMKAMTNYLSEI